MTQLALRLAEESRLDRAFAEFHAQNPAVYARLVELAHAARRRGHQRIGIKMLFEVLRWERYLETVDVSGFRLNNNWTSRYARLVMANEPTLAGMFETRELDKAAA